MNIKCKHCKVYFCPSEDTQDLIAGGYIESTSVNTCSDCWDLIYTPEYDLSEIYSDADSGLYY